MLHLLFNPSAGESVTDIVQSLPSLGFPTITVIIFVAAFFISLIIDLIQHKNSNEISLANATGWSIFWITLSMGFYAWLRWGMHATGEGIELTSDQSEAFANLFLTGYVLEKVLSIDNLIVFIAVFKFFDIKDVLQHKILYYGILGAIIFRGVFVGIGSAMLHVMGPWAEVIFGAAIGYAAYQMLTSEDDDGGDPDYESMFLVKMFNKIYPIFPGLVGNRFLISADEAKAESKSAQSDFKPGQGIKRLMTPAMVCLLVIEGSDVMFAFDSVPAVIAVTREPLLVYSAMIFAILGLRSLYFVLVALTKYLVHLEKAVLWVLVFISLKMFLTAAKGFEIDLLDHNVSLLIVLGMISMGIIASFIWPESEGDDESEDESENEGQSSTGSFESMKAELKAELKVELLAELKGELNNDSGDEGAKA
jgi:tellurite resistance protein TerC